MRCSSAACIFFSCLLAATPVDGRSARKATKFSVDDWVHRYDPESSSALMGKARRHVAIFYHPEATSGDASTYEAQVKAAATSIMNPSDSEKAERKKKNLLRSGKIIFLLVDASQVENSSIMHRFSVSAKQARSGPLLRALEMRKDGNYVFAQMETVYHEGTCLQGCGGVTKTTVVDFVFQLRAKKLPKLYMSAPEESVTGEVDPETNITEIVGSQYAELLRNDDFGTVVFTYLPGCGKCDSFREWYVTTAKLAKERAVQKLNFYTMDGSANESMLLGTKDGYPHVKMCPKMGKCAMFTSLEGELSDFLVFLQFHRYREYTKPYIYRRDLGDADPLDWTTLGGNGDVRHLVQENFDSYLEENEDENFGSIVMFYAPWCKASMRAKPYFASASIKVKSVRWASVNCVLHDQACSRRLDGAFPHFKAFPKGAKKGISFTGKRFESEFINFAVQMTQGKLVAAEPETVPEDTPADSDEHDMLRNKAIDEIVAKNAQKAQEEKAEL